MPYVVDNHIYALCSKIKARLYEMDVNHKDYALLYDALCVLEYVLTKGDPVTENTSDH